MFKKTRSALKNNIWLQSEVCLNELDMILFLDCGSGTGLVDELQTGSLLEFRRRCLER
jgi:hypothetical protein